MTSARRRELLRILRAGTASKQEDIVAALGQAGFEVTQATVSRELRAVGALKVRDNGGFAYRLPDDVPAAEREEEIDRNLANALAEFVIDVEPAGSLVVVRTLPGLANAVARAIDLAGVTESAGTIAGDDTVFVATRNDGDARSLSSRWGAVEEEAMT